MRRTGSAARLVAIGLLALGVVAVSQAWACVPQPLLFVQPPASAQPGDTVTVRGVNFRERAEIRLDGIDGSRLATGKGRQFVTKLSVPRVDAGIHVLTAITRDADGGLSAAASAPLEVLRAGGGRGVGAPPATARDSGGSASSADIAPGAAAAGGAALLVLGALLGALLARRRRGPDLA